MSLGHLVCLLLSGLENAYGGNEGYTSEGMLMRSMGYVVVDRFRKSDVKPKFYTSLFVLILSDS